MAETERKRIQLYKRWIPLYDGLEVASRRLLGPDGEMFTLADAARIDTDDFNSRACSYDRMDEMDPALVKFLKYAHQRSQRYGDGSFVPTNREYLDALLMAASKLTLEPGLPTFWHLFSEDDMDVTRDIVKIGKREKDGKCRAIIYRFDHDPKAHLAGPPVEIATDGWIRELDPLYGLPAKTTKKCGPVENISECIRDDAVRYGIVHLYTEKACGLPTSKGVKDLHLIAHHPCVNTGALDMSLVPLQAADEHRGALLLRRR